MGDRFGLVWYRADWELPATRVESWEEDGSVYDILLSDPVLVYDNEGDMFIALWEEDDDTGFRGWVDPHDGAVIYGVTHWRQLPEAPGGKHEQTD